MLKLSCGPVPLSLLSSWTLDCHRAVCYARKRTKTQSFRNCPNSFLYVEKTLENKSSQIQELSQRILQMKVGAPSTVWVDWSKLPIKIIFRLFCMGREKKRWSFGGLSTKEILCNFLEHLEVWAESPRYFCSHHHHYTISKYVKLPLFIKHSCSKLSNPKCIWVSILIIRSIGKVHGIKMNSQESSLGYIMRLCSFLKLTCALCLSHTQGLKYLSWKENASEILVSILQPLSPFASQKFWDLVHSYVLHWDKILWINCF